MGEGGGGRPRWKVVTLSSPIFLPSPSLREGVKKPIESVIMIKPSRGGGVPQVVITPS